VVAAPAVAAAAAVGPDYQNGFRDGLNKTEYRDRDRRNKAYADGYKAGQAKSTVIVASGPDFELGYRDGFNKIESRDRDRKNPRYAEGYKAGQAEMSALARPGTTRPDSPLAAARPDITQLLGRRDPDYVTDLRQMGYTQRNSYSDRDDMHGIWRGKDPNDCVHVMQRDGVVKQVERVEAASCR
jgi:hypothetical protein